MNFSLENLKIEIQIWEQINKVYNSVCSKINIIYLSKKK